MKRLSITTSQGISNVFLFQTFLDYKKSKCWNKNLKYFFVIDKKVFLLYKNQLKKYFDIDSSKKIFLLDALERNKSFLTVQKIHKFLIENNCNRNDNVVAIGGGIIGDVVGFAASTFMRGVNIIHIPTTFLAMIDSSIGGKTGINFLNRKNIIGTFHQPKEIIIISEFLETLSKEDYFSGCGELIKYSFLTEKNFSINIKKHFSDIINRNKVVLINTIIKCVNIKIAVVEQDEKEESLRKILNLGHTFGHAIESGLNYKIKHGLCVIAGIKCAVELSFKLNMISSEKKKEFIDLLSLIPLPTQFKSINVNRIFNLMKSDKKNRNGKIKLVLPLDFGKVLIDLNVEEKLAKNSIMTALQLS